MIRAIYEYGDWLLVGTSSGAFAYQIKEKRIQNLPFLASHSKPSDTKSRAEDYRQNVKNIHRNDSGNFLFLTVEGLYFISSKLLDKFLSAHGQGVRLSLDDFGTGYTSFQYLKDFPIDALKIDRSFVKDIGKEPKDEAIIDSIITLASKLGIQTIAEGVETQEQAKYLRDRGCPLTQGYLYSKPVPVEQALQLVKAGVIDI